MDIRMKESLPTKDENQQEVGLSQIRSTEAAQTMSQDTQEHEHQEQLPEPLSTTLTVPPTPTTTPDTITTTTTFTTSAKPKTALPKNQKTLGRRRGSIQ